MIELCISGFQCGCDISAIKTAQQFGIPVSGYIPNGFLTQDGFKPEYKTLYNAIEHESPRYPPRTEENVKWGDATFRFAGDFKSSGELCTLRFLKKYNKPYFDVDLKHLDLGFLNILIGEMIEFLEKHNVKILNIAGNSEKTYKGTYLLTSIILSQLFIELGFTKNATTLH